MTAPAQWRVVGGVRHGFPGGGKTALCGATPEDRESTTTSVCRVCMARALEAADVRERRRQRAP